MDELCQNIDLEPIWDAVVEVYQEIAKICIRHDLSFYMSDGNALGAARHGGFIPWDDDFDLTMPRPDYDQFVKYAKEELPSWLKYVNWENTPEFKFYFGKIQVTDKQKVFDVEKKVGFQLSNGIFVDIFPMDGYPTSVAGKVKLRFEDFCLNQMIRYKGNHLNETKGVLGKFLWNIGMVLSWIMPKYQKEADLRYAHERNFRRFPFDKSKLVGRCCTASSVLCRRPMRKSDWGDAVWVTFYKGEKFPMPSNPNAVLENEYGDWQTLPPVQERHPTHEYKERCPWWLGPTKQ